ncbi:hypothetical protein TNCV_4675031 [Trichonephila clavipes]|nr:hypothetical protein TNCV_4675031 [Trichonephila clavipes]
MEVTLKRFHVLHCLSSEFFYFFNSYQQRFLFNLLITAKISINALRNSLSSLSVPKHKFEYQRSGWIHFRKRERDEQATSQVIRYAPRQWKRPVLALTAPVLPLTIDCVPFGLSILSAIDLHSLPPDPMTQTLRGRTSRRQPKVKYRLNHTHACGSKRLFCLIRARFRCSRRPWSAVCFAFCYST